MSFVRSAVCVALLLCVAGVSHAAVIYDEGVSGDIDNWDDPPIFAFELGDNIVSGSTSTDFNTPTDDADPFAFTLPEGSQLSSVLFSHQLTTINGDWVYISVVSQISVFAEDGTWAGGESVFSASINAIFSDGSVPDIIAAPSPFLLNLNDALDGSIQPDSPTLPLTSGLYVFFNGTTTGPRTGEDVVNAAWDYSLTFTVDPVPVPEPGMGILFAIGLAGLGCARSRSSS